MAAVTVREGEQFDGKRTYNHMVNYLPSYARPRFIRIQVMPFCTHRSVLNDECVITDVFKAEYYFSIQNVMEVTGTFKQMKLKLAEEGFDPSVVQDPLYILDDREKSYTPMTAQLHSRIISGSLKL